MPRILHIESLAELRRAAPAWDDLWWRSDITLPMARAELVARWAEQFAPRKPLDALIVEDQGQWVAALPLVHCRMGGVLHTAALPWSPAGDLLWDVPAGDEARIADALVAALTRLDVQLVWLDGVRIDTPRWLALAAAVARADLPNVTRRQHPVARLEIDHDWTACQHTWSRKHRQRLNSCVRRLDALGGLCFQWIDALAPAEIEPWLRRIWAVEDASWKGAAGTSVLRSPDMFNFFLRQTRQAARWNQVALGVLECGGEPIAFCYGLVAKGVFHSCKIGYDPRYADFGPGHVLRYYLIEHAQADPQCAAIDFIGPWTDSHAHWRPDAYWVGRLMIAPRLLGRATLAAYKVLKRRAIRAESRKPEETKARKEQAAAMLER